ncbi:hypothetical protein, partial [Streptomyces prasinus]|uniref:hypothetical protein n=1 Tax=Streptomyces prasinus TaxID=67345 RepID=UPI001980B57D
MFGLSLQELPGRFGSDRVERRVRGRAKVAGFTGPTLDVLRVAGVPSISEAEIGASAGGAHHRTFDAVRGGRG